MFYWMAHGLFVVLSKLVFPIHVHGLENIPPKKGFILASNHLSNMDPMILGMATGHRLNYMAKHSLFKGKVFSWVLNQVGAFPVKRDSPDIGAVKEALKRLKGDCGRGLVVFPEGTRKAKALEQKAEPGVGLLSVKSGVPVIPAFIQGSDKVLAPGSKALKRGRVTVTFGRAVPYNKEDSYQEIANQIMAHVNSLCA
ncbi:MAG TPA: lysophospholipid acyltransferase family protein [Candidatus Omnitrophota bacterium]|nr:lysophospholipid acyltransferase family protein [Candidatus Omnitrophota bacterium]HPD83983.1 lysophospholipid acyltransferase family protein [Candidatus Omnitrophota bacterium]HRZ02840.1 lysophospholipid acyltransferase family protein [Candidatus Omnitrophota bacterium]